MPSNLKRCFTHCGAQYINIVESYTDIRHTENTSHWNRRAAKPQDYCLLPLAENKNIMLQWEVIGKSGRLKSERTPPGLTNSGFCCNMQIARQNCMCKQHESILPSVSFMSWWWHHKGDMFSCDHTLFVHRSVLKYLNRTAVSLRGPCLLSNRYKYLLKVPGA